MLHLVSFNNYFCINMIKKISRYKYILFYFFHFFTNWQSIPMSRSPFLKMIATDRKEARINRRGLIDRYIIWRYRVPFMRNNSARIIQYASLDLFNDRVYRIINESIVSMFERPSIHQHLSRSRKRS